MYPCTNLSFLSLRSAESHSKRDRIILQIASVAAVLYLMRSIRFYFRPDIFIINDLAHHRDHRINTNY